MEERETKSGIHVYRIHYTADPLKRTGEWLEEEAKGVPGGLQGRHWKREMEIDWTVASGHGIYSDLFRREYHVAPRPLKPVEGEVILRGFDFGLQPACCWAQVTPAGKILVLRELVTWDGRGAQVTRDARWLAEQTAAASARFYQGFAWEEYADPAGWQRSQADERTCVEVLNKQGIFPQPGPVTFEARRTAMRRALSRLVAGEPGLVVDPGCQMILEGLAGAYKYKESGVDSNAILRAEPVKNAWSHIINALEYIVGRVLPSAEEERYEEDEDRPADWREEEADPGRAGLYY